MRIRGLTTEQKELFKNTVKIDDEVAIAEFIKSRRLKNVRETTIKYYYDAFHVLKRDLALLKIDKQLIELSIKDMESIVEHWQTKLKVTSINSKIRAIKPFYSFLKEKNWIKKNPTQSISLLRDRTKIHETLEKEEIRKIANHLKRKESFVGYRNLVIFQLLLDTGIRINECLNIRKTDIQGNRLIVVESKNLEQRIVFLSKPMIESLHSYLQVLSSFNLYHDYIFINQDGERLAKGTFQEQLRNAARDVKIKKQVSPHVCRRTFAKNSVLKGMDAFTLKALLGHSTLEVTQKYVQMYGQDLESQAKKREDYSDLF